MSYLAYPIDDAGLLTLAAELAEAAAGLVMRMRESGVSVRKKQDRSPVTEADEAAESLILGGLRRVTPDIVVVAEEEVAAGKCNAASRDAWLIDPLDGTREFTAGRPDFTVNIGLVRQGRAVLGAVALPAHEQLFGGIVGQGAWRQAGGVKQAIHTRTPPLDGLDVYASRHYADDPSLPAFLSGRTVRRIINIGSAVKFCRLAEGAGDLFPRFGRTMEWDTAAPQAVLDAAGGMVRQMDGAPLRYGKPGYENPAFYCTGT